VDDRRIDELQLLGERQGGAKAATSAQDHAHAAFLGGGDGLLYGRSQLSGRVQQGAINIQGEEAIAHNAPYETKISAQA
jgi:hypothetical protein